MKLTLVAFSFLIAAVSGARGPWTSQDGQVPEHVSDDGRVAESKLIRNIPPEYPPLARQTRIEGTVRLEALIGKDGKVKELKVLSGHPLLIPSALKAVRQWQYEPPMVKGKRVEAQTVIEVVFALDDPSTANREASPDEGSISQGFYSNQFFKFRYLLPDGWTSYGSKAMNEMTEKGSQLVTRGDPAEEERFKSSATRTFKLLMISEYPFGTIGKETRSIAIIATRVSDISSVQSGKDYLLSVKRVAERANGPLHFPDEPYEVSFAGKQFFRLDGDSSSPEGLLRTSMVSTLLRGYVLSFTFASPYQNDLDSLCKTLETLQFEFQRQ